MKNRCSNQFRAPEPLLGGPEGGYGPWGQKSLSVRYSRNESKMTNFGLQLKKNKCSHQFGAPEPLLGGLDWRYGPGD
jgi:hypothetical protein